MDRKLHTHRCKKSNLEVQQTMTSLTSLTIGWAALLAIVTLLAIARRWAARHEDDSLHFMNSMLVWCGSRLHSLVNSIGWT